MKTNHYLYKMRLVFFLFLVIHSLQGLAQSESFNPDYDGDGCFSTNDFLQVLAIFGECSTNDGPTMYWFHHVGWPYGSDLSDESSVFYLPSSYPPGYSGTTDLSIIFDFIVQENGNQIEGAFVTPLDSLENVTPPFSSSIGNGTIAFPETTEAAPYYLIMSSSYNIDHWAQPIFYDAQNGVPIANPSTRFFEWNGGSWQLLRMPWANSTGSQILNIVCGE